VVEPKGALQKWTHFKFKIHPSYLLALIFLLDFELSWKKEKKESKILKSKVSKKIEKSACYPTRRERRVGTILTAK
jgi:hypothetical protein